MATKAIKATEPSLLGSREQDGRVTERTAQVVRNRACRWGVNVVARESYEATIQTSCVLCLNRALACAMAQ